MTILCLFAADGVPGLVCKARARARRCV